MIMISTFTTLRWILIVLDHINMSPLEHIIPILSQTVFALSPYCCVFSGETTNTNFIVFSLTKLGTNPQSTTLHVSTLTITPPMLLTQSGC